MKPAVAALLALLMAAIVAFVIGASISTGRITLYTGCRGQPLVITKSETIAFWSMMLLMSLTVGVLLLSGITG